MIFIGETQSYGIQVHPQTVVSSQSTSRPRPKSSSSPRAHRADDDPSPVYNKHKSDEGAK